MEAFFIAPYKNILVLFNGQHQNLLPVKTPYQSKIMYVSFDALVLRNTLNPRYSPLICLNENILQSKSCSSHQKNVHLRTLFLFYFEYILET
jgi:hypothetical protein